jgi:hypothetical protein
MNSHQDEGKEKKRELDYRPSAYLFFPFPVRLGEKSSWAEVFFLIIAGPKEIKICPSDYERRNLRKRRVRNRNGKKKTK